MNDLLQQLGAAVLRRNPGVATALQAPLDADHIRRELKRVGIKEHVEPIVTLYTWHNGAKFYRESESFDLGFAPPVVSYLPKAHIEFLEGLGHKVDPNRKLYDAFTFFEFDGGIGAVKLWKKFSKSLPDSAALAGRFFPFMSNKSGDQIAIDVTPEGRGRVVVIAKDKRVREAYDSLEVFLRDLIRANETNELLACVQTPGKPIALSPPPQVPKPAKKTQGARIPATDNPFVLRTDFSNEAAWGSLRSALENHDDEAAPALDFISDAAFGGLAPAKLRSLLRDDSTHTFAFVADQTTFSAAEFPVLVVDLTTKKPRSFRVLPAHLHDVSANLALGNMEFADFAKAADNQGVFRGFPSP